MSTGKSNKQNDWDRFSSFKQRGECVELQFMAQAARRRFAISRPWGETQAYDVGIEHATNFLRVQVKSTTVRVGAGYRCQCLPNKKHKYSLSEIDLFAAYVIPEDAWYLIPAVLLLGRRRHATAALCPVVPPAKKVSYRYECYREAWNLLNQSRNELLQCGTASRELAQDRSSGANRSRSGGAKNSSKRHLYHSGIVSATPCRGKANPVLSTSRSSR